MKRVFIMIYVRVDWLRTKPREFVKTRSQKKILIIIMYNHVYYTVNE